MKILQINGAVFGSTGKIMFGTAEAAEARGHEVMCAAPVTKTNRHRAPSREYVKIGSYYGRCASVLLSRITGLENCFAVIATWRFLRRVRAFSPDVIHLHNIHGSYINLPMLFRYIKKHEVRVIWSLHDCWSFTGHCPHFDLIGCQKWKKECSRCPQYKGYPKSYIDNSRYMHRLKKKWFLGVKDMMIVATSRWQEGLVKQSFLRAYPIPVIYDGINLEVFKPCQSDFRKKYGCEDKFIVLGVSFEWGMKKGLDVFLELASRLDDRFRIVLVGTNEKTDELLPDSIISIHRTQNQKELAEIYSAADLFVNATREETLGLVNIEALACGTPVLTFRTGGSPEIPDESCGSSVDRDDVDGMEREILRIFEENCFRREACCKRALNFDEKARCGETVSLYDR